MSENYIVNANVSSNYAYAGEAKKQAEVISFMKELVKKRPEFISQLSPCKGKIICKRYLSFKHSTNNVNEVVELMNKLEIKTYELCKVNTY